MPLEKKNTLRTNFWCAFRDSAKVKQCFHISKTYIHLKYLNLNSNSYSNLTWPWYDYTNYETDASQGDGQTIMKLGWPRNMTFPFMLSACMVSMVHGKNLENHGNINSSGRSCKMKKKKKSPKFMKIHGNWLWVWAACGCSSLPAFCVVFVRCLKGTG